MAQPKVCCRHLKAPDCQRLSVQMIMTDYYDGPTAGVFKCDLCDRAYRFFMIDWDDHQEVRIHALSALPKESFKRIELMKAQRGPKWWPEGREVDEILATAVKPEMVAAFCRWFETVLAARDVTEDDSEELQEWLQRTNFENMRDWFAFLGLRRGDEDRRIDHSHRTT